MKKLPRQTFNTFRLSSCTVLLVMLDFFFVTSEPYSLFYVMAALCTVDCTDQIRCIDMTLCCYEKHYEKLH